MYFPEYKETYAKKVPTVIAGHKSTGMNQIDGTIREYNTIKIIAGNKKNVMVWYPIPKVKKRMVKRKQSKWKGP